MTNLNLRRIFTVAGSVSLLLIYVFLWVRTITDPAVRTGSDFIGIYTFGRIARTDGFQHIYDFDRQETAQEEAVGFQTTPEYFAHVPYVAPLAALITSPNYVDSFNRWSIILVILNGINTCLLLASLGMQNIPRSDSIILSIGTFLFFPTFSGFMNGQDDAFLLLGAATWVWGLFRERHFIAGLGLSLTTIRPQIAIFLAVPFLFRYRKVFWGFVLGSVALGLFSLVFIKIEGTYAFLASLRTIESTIWIQPHALDMPSLSGIIRRNFAIPNFEPVRTLIWGCYALGIVFFSIVWRANKEISEKLTGLLVLSAILLVPYSHYHDLTLLLIPIFCLLRLLYRKDIPGVEYLATIPLFVSILAISGFAGSGDLKFPIIYLVMLILGYLLVAPDTILPSRQLELHQD